MSKTTNYGLEKPEQDDYYDVDVFNDNADIVDEELAKEATDTQLGRTKLTDSSAVTDSTGLALPATEKNASITGTLANQISQLNTDMFRSENKVITGILVPANSSVVVDAEGFGTSTTVACIINTFNDDYILGSGYIMGEYGDSGTMRVTLHNTYSADKVVNISAIRICLP